MSRSSDPIAIVRRRIARSSPACAPMPMPTIATLIERIDRALAERRSSAIN